MKINLTIISLLTILISLAICQDASKLNYFKDNRLTKKWESPQEFKTPESVYYDAKRKIIYVANINGSPTAKDNNGFVSKLSLTGKIVDLKWIKELNAPKGMGVFKGKLYVSDIDQVVEIDIDKSKILNRYEADGAKFLNDISIDKSGNVYISDMVANRIYRLKNGSVDIWLESDELNGPNGLFVENNYLLVGIKGSVLKIGLNDKKVSAYISDTGGIDGIVPDGSGNYLISDWKGNIHLINPKKEKIKLLDTTPINMNAADIDFIIEKKLLLIPTFSDNRVTAYSVKTK
jgi:sugar lactone lactonase YvrE